MAIYSLHLGFISRSQGRSCVGFSAYISGSRGKDTRTGNAYDFSKKQHVIEGQILAPKDAEAWAEDRSTLWNKVEVFEDQLAEKRYRGGDKSQDAKEKFLSSTQTAQTVMGALPVELSLEQSEALTVEFLKARFVNRGLVVEYALHNDPGNPHFHALVTRRPLINGAFAERKDREIVSKREHLNTRLKWAEITNKHLMKAGLPLRIDALSNADRGSLLMPGQHEGSYAQRLAEQGEYARLVEENKEIQKQNLQIIIDRPEALIQEVAFKRLSFTKEHVMQELIKRVGGDDKLFSMLKSSFDGMDIDRVYDPSDMHDLAEKVSEKLLQDKSVTVDVGHDLAKRPLYSSLQAQNQEKSILDSATQLAKNQRAVTRVFVDEAIERIQSEKNIQLSQEQTVAINHLCGERDLAILNGRAGTGKTTLLRAVAEAYQRSGYRVMGTAFQGKVAEVMASEVGVPCHTLDRFFTQWKRYEEQKANLDAQKLWGKPYIRAVERLQRVEKFCFKSKDIIIIDEANMVGGDYWEKFLQASAVAGSKVIIVQDPAQIKARQAGDVGRLLADRFGKAETKSVLRQQVDWQKQASVEFNERNIFASLEIYDKNDRLYWGDFASGVEAQMARHFAATPENENRIALAFINDEVMRLNQKIRQELKRCGQLDEGFTIAGVEYALGEKIRFTKNDNYGKFVRDASPTLMDRILTKPGAGVKNGTFGTIISHSEGQLRVKLQDGRLVEFDTEEYSAFTHRHAMSIHKSEGSTFDHSFVLASQYMDPATLLVAMTRHRKDVGLYINRQDFVDMKDLTARLGRSVKHHSLADYDVDVPQQPYLERIQEYSDVIHEVMILREEIESEVPAYESIHKHEAYESYQFLNDQRKKLAKDIMREWKGHMPFARLAGLRKDWIEVDAGLRKRPLSELEKRAEIQVNLYQKHCDKAKNLWKGIQQTHPGSLGERHQNYDQYEKVRKERDEIAFHFNQTPRFYRPFFYPMEETADDKSPASETTPESKDFKRVFWSSVEKHAKAYQDLQAESKFVEELSEKDKTFYERGKTYIKLRNHAAATYAQYKQDPKQPDQLLQSFKALQIKRDALALQLMRDEVDTFHERLNIEPVKLCEQADFARIREWVGDFREMAPSKHKSELATTILDRLKSPRHFQILKEFGMTAKDLRCQARAQQYMGYDHEEILITAKDRVAQIAYQLLGHANSKLSTSGTLRFGRKGSLSVTLKGSRAGQWYDFQKSEGGNIVSLVQQEKKLDYKDAMDYLGRFLGLRPHSHNHNFKAPPTPRASDHDTTVKAEATAEKIAKLAVVQKLYQQSRDIAGTVAERYLRERRHIKGELAKDLRFLPCGTCFQYNDENKKLYHDSLAVFAKDKDGVLLSVQVTRLDQNASRAQTRDGEKFAKTKYGLGKDAFVVLANHPESHRVIIAEGLETALSIQETGIKATIVASQGLYNLKNYQGPEQNIIIAADNDSHKENSGTKRLVEKAKAHLQEQGKSVQIIEPQTPGQDFNDVLVKEGIEGVKACVQSVEIEPSTKAASQASRLHTPKVQEVSR